ncbi:MAG: YceI family protein [Acidobacteria bacterium]|nr:YceI family protein [Acidobacteriota bacterium]
MKRVLALGVLAVAAVYAYVGIGVRAIEPTITERFAAAGAVQTGDSGAYNFDKAHSFIGFKVKHMGLIEVPGFFRDFTGTVNYDAKDVTKSSVEFTAKTTSVDTGVAPRDRHLRTADFFDVEKFPDLTFKSTKVEKKGKNLMVTGDFTLRGVTKSISFPVQIAGFLGSERGTRMGVTGETSINRRDFGVNYGKDLPNGTAELSDDVKITLQIEANMSKQPAAAKTE